MLTAIPHGFSFTESLEPKFLCVSSHTPGSGCVCVVRILGSCAPGNMQGNMLEHAELGQASSDVANCLAWLYTHTHTDMQAQMHAHPLTILTDLGMIICAI